MAELAVELFLHRDADAKAATELDDNDDDNNNILKAWLKHTREAAFYSGKGCEKTPSNSIGDSRNQNTGTGNSRKRTSIQLQCLMREYLGRDLIHGEPNRTVISMVGMGRVGKSTLIRKVVDEHITMGHFDCHAWINVSQSYKRFSSTTGSNALLELKDLSFDTARKCEGLPHAMVAIGGILFLVTRHVPLRSRCQLCEIGSAVDGSGLCETTGQSSLDSTVLVAFTGDSTQLFLYKGMQLHFSALRTLILQSLDGLQRLTTDRKRTARCQTSLHPQLKKLPSDICNMKCLNVLEASLVPKEYVRRMAANEYTKCPYLHDEHS
ncbi:hypothetical protein V6N11_031763 [Hibiscus sabdariffa]|uniref:NB-ARC domain-containing protein n=1 Tax=Hibiscus sabdariffa TaxID=183260 RepID=A0ABR2SZ92_9ROSI